MSDQLAKAQIFASLHSKDSPLLMPNPWDIGSTRILQSMGFQALATTSLGVANHLGSKSASKLQVIENCHQICAATDLPVNADLENGFSHDPQEAAEVLREAYAAGAVGGSLEDFTGDLNSPIYDLNHAVERISAAVEVRNTLPGAFVLTARAEDRLYGRMDLDETIKRLQAFETSGADVLYAPGLYSREEIKMVTDSVTKPVNVVMGFADPTITFEDLKQIGVSRISIGGAFSRIALSAMVEAATQMKNGNFEFVGNLTPLGDLQAMF